MCTKVEVVKFTSLHKQAVAGLGRDVEEILNTAIGKKADWMLW